MPSIGMKRLGVGIPRISNHYKKEVVKQASKRITRASNQPSSGMQLKHFIDVIMTSVPALNYLESHFQSYSSCPSTYQHFCLK